MWPSCGDRLRFRARLSHNRPMDDASVMASLLVAIKKTPEDDEPRRRYAERFVARGHPRGRWALAQLDAADPRASASVRAAAEAEAAAGFEAALSSTDTRVRSDLARERPSRLAFLRPNPEIPEVCVLRLGLLSLQPGCTSLLETIYDLHYRRGMLDGIDVRRAVELDSYGVVPVLKRAAVRWLRCAGRLLPRVAFEGGVESIHTLRLFGEVSGESLLRSLTMPRSVLRELDLVDAIVLGDRAELERGIPNVTIRWPDEARPPTLEHALWSTRELPPQSTEAFQLLAPSPRGALALSPSALRCWMPGREAGTRQFSTIAKEVNEAFVLGQGRETGAWIAAFAPTHPGAPTEPVTLYRGQGEARRERLADVLATPRAVTIREDGQSAAWWTDEGGLEVLEVLHPRLGAAGGERPSRLATPGSGYQALLWLPGDAGLLARRGDVIDRIALPPRVSTRAPAPVLDAAYGLCVLEEAEEAEEAEEPEEPEEAEGLEALAGLEAPVEWPGTAQTPPLLVCDAVAADAVRRLERGTVVGYSAARGVVALRSPLGITLWSLRTGEEVAVLPCEVEQAMFHPTLPYFFGRDGAQILGAALPLAGAPADVRPRLAQLDTSEIVVDGAWGRYVFEGSYASSSGGDPWGGWESNSYFFKLSRRGEQLWVLVQHSLQHLGGEDLTDTWYTSLDGGRTFAVCAPREGEAELLGVVSAR